MTEAPNEYLADVEKYDPQPDRAAVDGIVKHLGIALRNRDASLVAASDPTEMQLVRDSFLKKKLGLTESDTDLDASVREVTDQTKGDRSKSRVTVYYLLAKKYGKLADLH